MITKNYVKINWQNLPSVATPLGMINMNKMDSQIDTNENNIISLDITKANQTDLQSSLKTVTYDSTTGTFVFTYWNGNTLVADLNIEKIPVSFSMSPEGVITMITTDGSVYTADLASIIKTYTFEDSSEIDFQTTTDSSGNKIITASIVNGSINGEKLQPNYLADCQIAKQGAESAEISSQEYAGISELKSHNAEAWADGEINGVPVPTTHPAYHNNAKYYSEQSNPTLFANLSDVQFENLQNNQVPKWDSVSQKWKNGTGAGGGSWGEITGNIEDQEDLQDALDSKQDVLPDIVNNKYLHTNATTGALEWSEVGDANDVELTKAEYDALPDSKLTDNVNYYITDWSEGGGGISGSIFNITIPENMIGDTFTISKGTESYTKTPTEETFSVNVLGCGVYTITNTTKSQSMEFNAPYFGIYEVSFNVMNFNEWLQAGGIIQTFANLDAVLADEPTVRILMTKHAAVDYLTEWAEVDIESITKILNNDICAKWINLRDYALDTLYANNTCKTIMDTADKYFYGEWALLPQVPIMTSDTAPYGEASAYREGSGYGAYKAFDGDPTTQYTQLATASLSDFIMYKFVNPVCVKRFSLLPNSSTDVSDYSIKGSNDNVNWVTLYSGTNSSNVLITQNIDNDNYYLYYKLTNDKATSYYFGIKTLQFYAWGPLGNVPVMTSNTAPYGEAFGKSQQTSGVYDYWKAFNRSADGDQSTWASASNDPNAWIGYHFVNPVCAKRVHLQNRIVTTSDNHCRILTFKVQASNDNITWTDITDVIDRGSGASESGYASTHDFENNNYYSYYRILPVTSTTDITGVAILQFYGRELKSSVPVMTSNTEPWGEAIGSSGASKYKAFWTGGGSWDSTSNTNQWVGYDFGEPIKVLFSKASAVYYSEKRAKNYKVEYSDDGTEWTTVPNSEGMFSSSASNEMQSKYIDNVGAHRYWRYFVLDKYGSSNVFISLFDVNFYGFDYSEHDERHYIYDHGIELEEVGLQGNTISKDAHEIFVNGSGYPSVWVHIDTTPYELIRAIYGDKGGISFALSCGTNGSSSSNISNLSTRAQVASDLPNNLYADITNVSQLCYQHINSNSSSATSFSINEWWLE